MKILVLLFVFLASSTIIESSYAQSPDQQKPTPKFFVQLQLYDSNGYLVGYIQGRPEVYDVNRTIAWVSPHATHEPIVYEGQKYDLLKFVDNINGGTGISPLGYYFVWDTINGQQTTIFREWHDSILTNTGDIAKVYWEILNPSD